MFSIPLGIGLIIIGLIIWAVRKKEQQESTKQCPKCAENIQMKALVCRYCGEDVSQVRAKNWNKLHKVCPGCSFIDVPIDYTFCQNAIMTLER